MIGEFHKVRQYRFVKRSFLLATNYNSSPSSGKTVKIDKIRSDDENPGLRDFEASFLRLLEKVTNGSVIEISYTGTSVLYKPGVITGGKISHDCGTARAIGYYLEPMIAIAPFAKSPFNLTLSGITNDNVDVSVDLIRTVTLLQLRRFGVGDGIELKESIDYMHYMSE
ncbi:4601_t:CDS:2, partial [Ambispora leptoticha]